jgi:hypothetical protein
MNAPDLMLRELHELRASIESSDPYVVLRAAAIVRRLLLDRTNLVDQANRQLRQADKDLRIKPVFRVAEEPSIQLPPDCPPPDILCSVDGIYPDKVWGEQKILELNKDRFLAYAVVKYRGKAISVRKLVDFLANTDGAVHLGEPRDEDDAFLRLFNQNFGISGIPATIVHMRGISRVILDALTPYACATLRYRLLLQEDALLYPYEDVYARILFQESLRNKEEPLCAAFALALCRLAIALPHEMANLSNAVWVTVKHLSWLSPERHESAVRKSLQILESLPRDNWNNSDHAELTITILLSCWLFYAAQAGEIKEAEDRLRRMLEMWRKEANLAETLSLACCNAVHGDPKGAEGQVGAVGLEIGQLLLSEGILTTTSRARLMRDLGIADPIASSSDKREIQLE